MSAAERGGDPAPAVVPCPGTGEPGGDALPRPPDKSYLNSVVQEPGETLRRFTPRFCHASSNRPIVPEATVIQTFHQNVHDVRMLEKLGSRDIYTERELIKSKFCFESLRGK